jgi:hypothetical protein
MHPPAVLWTGSRSEHAELTFRKVPIGPALQRIGNSSKIELNAR